MSEHFYNITPTQLDAYQALVDADMVYERYYGRSDSPYITCDEFSLQTEARLIDMINRCPQRPSESMAQGTAFNTAVDSLAHGIGRCDLVDSTKVVCTESEYKFVFDRQLVNQLALQYRGGLAQFYCTAPLLTGKGKVYLYGYIDEWVKDTIIDIKTCKYFNTYIRKWQRHVYPYCIVEGGYADSVNMFRYDVVKLYKRGGVITGEYSPEIYQYDHDYSRNALIAHCEDFISWLELRRKFITDQKIFGGVNPDNYVGIPVSINNLKKI